MKESSNGSGITIVELVIFLATVMILIGTLLPNRDSSNLSTDKNIINAMNAALTSATPSPSTLEEAIEALELAGFNKNELAPTADNCVYAWGKSEKAILLLEVTEDGVKIIYPEKYIEVQYDSNNHFIISALTKEN